MVSVCGRIVSISSALVVFTSCAALAAANETDRREWEARVQKAIDVARPAVVAVKVAAQREVPPGQNDMEIFASGVIISDDGLILSQYHVSHQKTLADATSSAALGSRTAVVLHDGSRHEAIRLGADRVHDVSLLKMVEPGPWPHAALDEQVAVRAGDDILKLGYPGGYQQGRPASVRAGRVIQAQADRFVTDCLVIGGDSGGPFFDLNGRLIGIIQNSAAPSEVYVESTKTPRRSFFTGVTPNRVIAKRLAAMRKNKIIVEIAANEDESAGTSSVLPGEQWTQGSDRTSAARQVTALLAHDVVPVVDGSRQVALGLFVSADGEVLSKASVLPSEPACRLPGGDLLPAQVVAVDPATDLALLRVSTKGATKVEFGAQDNPAVGQWVAALGTQPIPLAIGIVSMPRRDFAGPFPEQIRPARRVPATLPEIIGSAVEGRGYWVEFAEGLAAAAGITPGDVIVAIADVPVRSHQALADAVRGRWAGESVPVEVIRSGKSKTLSLLLRSRPGGAYGGRSDGFAVVFESDLPLFENELGGAVLDAAGKVIGVAIARGAVGCLVIPAGRVAEALAELRSGKLAGRWSPERPQTPTIERPAGKAVTMSVEELREQLRERQSRFKALLVEYDVVSEAHIDPMRLVQWGLHNVRDYRERHRVGFASEKRMTEVRRPAPQLEYVPADMVAPDPSAPEAVRRSVENARRSAASRRKFDDFDYFVAIGREEIQRTFFDGRDCYIGSNVPGRYTKVPPDNFYGPLMYLANLGLRPVDPAPSEAARRSQQQFWLPDSFDQYASIRLRELTETIDGAEYVVLEAERQQEWDNAKHMIRDTIWLAPDLAYAPRRWEQTVDGLLNGFRQNSDFVESAPGCWLPHTAVWTRCCPEWTPQEFRGKPAYSYRMTLRQGLIADQVPAGAFEPK